MRSKTEGKILGYVVGLAVLLTAGVLGLSFYLSTSTIDELLTENRRLSSALQNLTEEDQIAYATVQEQKRTESGELQTVVRLVQTAAGNPREIVTEQLFTVPGDTIHFDALIVKFDEQLVQDGKERALYLWRRIYGDATRPKDGEPIEIPGSAPERYFAITKSLRMQNRDIFWEAIWDLANDPDYLSRYGVTAVYGNAVYTRMQPGKIYQFKINSSGQIYPEVIDAR